MLFEVDTQGLDAWLMAARRFEDALPDLMDDTEHEVAELVAGETRRRVPVLSGAARQSVRVLDYSGDATVVGGSSGVRYFGWLNYGGRTGRQYATVRPKVRRGRYIYPAYEDSEPEIVSIMDDQLLKSLRAHGLA